MKYLIIPALLLLTSCLKQRDWLCTIEQTNPEGVVYHTKVIVPFRGNYYDMKRYEQAGTFGVKGVGAWQTVTCK